MCGLDKEATIEWCAAAALETAFRALHEIELGSPDPRAIAAVALMILAATAGED